MTDDIVTRLRRLSERNKASRFGDLIEDWSGEAADEIERLRTSPTLTAPQCPTCHHPQEPELLEVTAFGDTHPRWAIGWSCNNTYLHKQINKRNTPPNA
jgi:hypothetical protein